MQKKYILLLFIFSLCILGVNISSAQIFNYTPGVEVGDELVYKIEEVIEGERTLIYYKYNISDIYDSPGETHVEAEYSSSEDGIIFTYHAIISIGWLGNYTDDPLVLTDYKIIIPGTKVGTYKEEILFHLGDGYKVSSFAWGYGVKIKWDDNLYTREFNKQGIMEKTESNIDGQIEETILISFNGENYRSIPGYPVYILVVSSLIGVLGMLFFMRARVNQAIK